MIVEGRFTFDTNVLVYAVDTNAGSKHDTARRLLLDSASHDAWLTLQALGEFFHVTTRKGTAKPERAIEYLNAWQDVFNIVAADQTCLNEAVTSVVEHSLSFWDALLCATARHAGCGYLISENMHHGHRVGGIEVVDPFSDEGQATIAELMDR